MYYLSIEICFYVLQEETQRFNIFEVMIMYSLFLISIKILYFCEFPTTIMSKNAKKNKFFG